MNECQKIVELKSIAIKAIAKIESKSKCGKIMAAKPLKSCSLFIFAPIVEATFRVE